MTHVVFPLTLVIHILVVSYHVYSISPPHRFPHPQDHASAQKVKQYEWASFYPTPGATPPPSHSDGRGGGVYTVHLQAYSKNLTMTLKEVAITEYDDVEVTLLKPDGKEVFKVSDLIHYYRGRVEELPGSRAHGVLRKNGLFEGVIEAGTETYFVESEVRFFGNTSRIKSSKEPGNRAIIYRWEDLKLFPVELACEKNDPSCYYYQTVLHYKALFPPTDDVAAESIQAPVVEPPKVYRDGKTCHIQVIADHRFFQNVGFSSVQKTIEAIVWHIEESDHLFRSTNWTQRVGVALKKILIFTSPDTLKNPFLDDGMDDEKFLKQLRYIDTSEACVAMVFTFSYLQGTFGISYVGTVCNPRYNWALVNFRNMDGALRQRAASVITVMHEIAHVFGANHDNVGESAPACVPAGTANNGDNGGNFIMYPTSAMGMFINNRQFSPCSLTSIGTNLESAIKTKCMAAEKKTSRMIFNPWTSWF